MKTLLLPLGAAVSLGAIAVPAHAQPRHSDRLAGQLADPALQDSMADAIGAMSEALLDMPVAPIARVMDAIGDPDARDIDPRATVGDLAGPEARRMPREMARKVPQMMGAMAEMSDAIAAMTPQLEAIGRRMRDRMEDSSRH